MPALIESVVDNNKRRVLVRKNRLDDKTVRYIGVYGGHLGVETDDVIYIFDKCYKTLYVNDRKIETPEWMRILCKPLQCGQKEKKKEWEEEL
ncbi:MAG: hypothetical protein QXT27_05010 [Pyrobaculum sp.]